MTANFECDCGERFRLSDHEHCPGCGDPIDPDLLRFVAAMREMFDQAREKQEAA